MTETLTEPHARRLVDLGRDLSPAAPVSDVIDILAVGIGAKPLAGVAACFTEDGAPAWDDVASNAVLTHDRLGDRLDDAGLDWHLTPVETVDDGEETVTWYELLVGSDGRSLPDFLAATGPRPTDRTERQYGRALGYPESSVEWFVTHPVDVETRSVFDVINEQCGSGDDDVTLAASVPYIPAPTRQGARDALDDGRGLTEALGTLDAAADEDGYAELLLGERVRETLDTYDQRRAWRDPLSRAMG
ncbi:hypothetical protein [Halomarina ordinaria]|uniref:PAC2 family protein n=1 Tax=Halomarina ordinaria TaxID=3033939 RepID=A0ABD5UEZ9_9EURY|nr:hypothetical protein [Halomarina sp. PSRA2]